MAERELTDTSPSPSSSLNSPDCEPAKSRQFLTVDETKRPRANSDPVGLHLVIANLPQITVTGDDGQEGYSKEDSEVDSFLVPPAPRQRSNTCPDDMFRLRRGRPPTPPPTDIMKSPGGKKKFSFNFNTKDLNGISFTHHRLCKVSEDGGEFVTKSNQNIRPSHAVRRASCLAALSEATTSIEEQKEEDSSVPTLHLTDLSRTTSTTKPTPQTIVDTTSTDKDFQSRIDNMNPTKSNVLSEGVSINASNIVNSRFSNGNGREAGDKTSLKAC